MTSLPKRIASVLLSMTAVVACTSDGEGPLTVEAFADPEVCDVPCEVVLDSGILEAASEALTFTWDFGEGPVEGDARKLHVFETAGTYEVSITASDGSQTTTDTITVRAEPQSKQSSTIDEGGGAVSQGAATVTVPADVAPEPVLVELTELPSMQVGAERALPIPRFTALGSAFQVSTPLKTAAAMDVAVNDSVAMGAHPETLAWLIRWVAQPVTGTGETDVLSRAPLAAYGLAPVSRVDEDGTVHGSIFGDQRLQLVTLAEPMNVDSFEIEAQTPATQSSASGAFANKALTLPLVVITAFNENPSIGWEVYAAVVQAAAKKTHEVLVTNGGFVGPEGILTVVVEPMPDPRMKGYVAVTDHHTVHLSSKLFSSDEIEKYFAHEFFHLIQNLASNRASLYPTNRRLDAWFKEGTADWAADEVFDDTEGLYHATEWTRFEVPLNQEGYDKNNEYQTVGFWKWAESQKPNIVQDTINHRFLLTHKFAAGPSIVQNTAVVDYLSAFKTEWPDVDFLEYTHAARYSKDFDASVATGEHGTGDLWAPDPYLGPAKTVYTRPEKTGLIEAGGAGESEANPLQLLFNLKQHLTADVLQIASPSLEGALHIRFPQTGNAPVEAEVLMLDRTSREVEDVKLVLDLRNGPTEVAFSGFDSEKEAVILIVEPVWEYDAFDTPIPGVIEAWVENPCGPLPPNPIEVAPGEDLANVVEGASGGAVIRLAPGNYAPPIRDWTLLDGFGTWPAQLLLNDVTLAGSGEGNTIITMTGDEFDAVGFSTYGSATIRDLTIDGGDFFGLTCLRPKDITLCNVTITSNGHDGVTLSPWPGGGSTSLRVYESTITQLGTGQGTWGIGLFCSEDAGDVTAEVSDSNISGWFNGIYYSNNTEAACSVSLTTDCAGFSDNDQNVWRETCTPPTCTGVEECP